MFREMRRKKQQLSEKETIQLLKNGTSGVLAVQGEDGYPYAVPLSHVYLDGKLYFHCAKSGQKLDAIRQHAKASFCVVAQDQVMPAAYTTYYKSVIAFGTVRILKEEAEIRRAINALALRFYPDGTEEELQREINQYSHALCVLEFTIDHITGKQARELTNQAEGSPSV